jgi:Transglycosylase SLT domain
MSFWDLLGQSAAKSAPLEGSQSFPFEGSQGGAPPPQPPPGPSSGSALPNTLPDNSGLTADAATQHHARAQAHHDVLYELNHNLHQAASNLHAYQEAGDKQIQDLNEENENDLNSLNLDQGMSSGIVLRATLNRVSVRLQQIQTIRKQQWELQNQYAHEAMDLAEQYANVAPISLNEVQYDPNPQAASGQAAYTNYINQALDVMGISDATARANWMNGLLTAAPRESSYQPWAVNTWDSNAVGEIMPDNAPHGSSRGAFQVTPTTFANHHLPGTSNNIYDPVANVTAAMNYLMTTYGILPDGSNLSSVQQFNPNASPKGY